MSFRQSSDGTTIPAKTIAATDGRIGVAVGKRFGSKMTPCFGDPKWIAADRRRGSAATGISVCEPSGDGPRGDKLQWTSDDLSREAISLSESLPSRGSAGRGHVRCMSLAPAKATPLEGDR